jgi:hypothetical protein
MLPQPFGSRCLASVDPYVFALSQDPLAQYRLAGLGCAGERHNLIRCGERARKIALDVLFLALDIGDCRQAPGNKHVIPEVRLSEPVHDQPCASRATCHDGARRSTYLRAAPKFCAPLRFAARRVLASVGTMVLR